MTKKETQYEKYLRNGNEIFETYCSTGDKHPIMLPRAPQQKYIDLYPEDQPGCSFENDRNQQLNYEAEVIVYRALEKLSGGDFIVLHSFEYTHFQYYLGDSKHDKRKCTECKKRATNREGECDFIVITPNYFFIMEVKNMGHIGNQSDPGCNKDQQSQALAKTFQKSLDQRKKMVEFVKRFCKRLTVLQFTVYPNFQKAFKKDFQLSRYQLSSMIFKEDLEEFSDWWKDNVSDLVLDEPLRPEFRTKHEHVRNLLLAIWCTDKTICDKSKCSLGKCIVKVNEQLRSGRFTFRSNNPDIIRSPKIVKDFLGIDNLTKQQYDLINSDEKLLWINGPAGTGKTVVLLAKILKLALSSYDNKIVFFCEACVIDEAMVFPEHLHKPLEKAGVKHVTIFYREWTENIVGQIYRIRDYLYDNQIVIIMLRVLNAKTETNEGLGNTSLIKFIILLQGKGIHVCFDDMQGLFSWSWNKEEETADETFQALFELSSSSHVWIACDTLQTPLFYYNIDDVEKRLRLDSRLTGFVEDELSSTQLVSLSKNLRNTSDLSRTLSVIREHIIEQGHIVSTFINDLAILQAPGHYIHGPKTIVHVLQKFKKKLICDIFDIEFNELCFDNMIDSNDVGIIYTDNLDLVKINVDGILLSKDITPRLVMSTYSQEWPAVIVLQTLVNDKLKTRSGGSEKLSVDLEFLYLAMSRARVKCTVIMFPLEGTILEENHRMCSLLDKLKDSVEVRYH